LLTALAIATEAASKVTETMSPSLHPRMDDEPPQRALLPSHGSCAPSQLALKGSSQLGPSHAPYRAARKDTASEGGGGESIEHENFAEGSSDLDTIIQKFVDSPSGQKYKAHDCKTVTRTFVAWAEQNNIPTEVITFAPPSAEFVQKNPQFKGKSGQGDGHIIPIVNGNAIDFTIRQFGVNRPFDNPLVTPVSNIKSVYSKFGYFTDTPDWFLNGKTHWRGPLKSIPSTIFNQDFGDELLENFADGKNPQDKGDSKRHGINTKASVSSLRKTAKQGGRKGQLAHWLANMKAGRAKKNK
jgi:hypothetical protein